tara:strand:- start:2897 stop:3295 length:399 start_codon:yes stop_codon:yes gene_type:complete
MSDKSTLTRAFNNLFFDFINDIINIYPENRDIAKAKTSFETIKKMNPSLVIKMWHPIVYVPYQKEINSGNMEFFFKKNYADDVAKMGNNSEEILKLIDKVRGPISTMNSVNQGHCAKYVQKLSKLGMVYSQL